MMRMPAFRAAGIASLRRALAAGFPAQVGDRPREGERKKFCMSIITRAALKGSMRMGVVVVGSLKDEAGEGIG